MAIIYEPRGAAAEYSPLACNLYRGCAHGCRYCYAPSCLRMNRGEFHSLPAPRADVLEALRREAGRVGAPAAPILLCFTSDPYQPLEADALLTRQAIAILGEARRRVRVLTKNPALAMRDVDLFCRHDVEVGVSLCWRDDARRASWEPKAGTVEERLDCLDRLRESGVRTWVSMEPVIDPAEALAVLNRLAGAVGVVKIGKINHSRELSEGVDWRGFALAAVDLCRSRGQAYYLKDDLWRACGPMGTVAKASA